jgi:outer membrane protein OmpA-like peptidoglycan-associated protein/polyisoprenoid-binding protein YceI
MGRVFVALLLAAFAFGGAPRSAQAQDWALNAATSRFYMQTAKANAVIETHRFTGLDGGVTKDGDAIVKIDLLSVKSGIDVRDVRMRFLLFETFKFPFAEVTAKLDMAKLQELTRNIRVSYPLKFRLNLHGVTREIEAPVWVTRLTDKSVSVATEQPIIVTAESHDLAAGVVKLSEAVNGTPIVSAASITFDLIFETGDKLPEIEATRAEMAKRRSMEESAAISTEACETRLSVISTAQAIYFKTGSAELDAKSDALLDSVADIANRCPAARIEVAGHTDSVGSKEANRALSESRARSVVSYLSKQGVASSRIESTGYGDTRPIKPNDSEANRAANRRIEFRVKAR